MSAEELLIQDYFANNAKFTDDQFIRRFRMSRALFLKIVTDLESKYDFFSKLLFDARMQKSFTALQKCTSAIRQLAYGNTADALDEYLNMSERVSRRIFAQANIQRYSTFV